MISQHCTLTHAVRCTGSNSYFCSLLISWLFTASPPPPPYKASINRRIPQRLYSINCGKISLITTQRPRGGRDEQGGEEERGEIILIL